MCNSFNSSISPSFRFQRFDLKGKSVRLQRHIKALLANWPEEPVSVRSSYRVFPTKWISLIIFLWTSFNKYISMCNQMVTNEIRE